MGIEYRNGWRKSGVACNCPFDAVGNTPMMRIGRIFAKFEAFNITGSVKDRMVSYIIRKAEERGQHSQQHLMRHL